MELLRGIWVQAQVELVYPAELKAGFADSGVAGTRTRHALGQVGRMGSHLVGNNALLHVVAVG